MPYFRPFPTCPHTFFCITTAFSSFRQLYICHFESFRAVLRRFAVDFDKISSALVVFVLELLEGVVYTGRAYMIRMCFCIMSATYGHNASVSIYMRDVWTVAVIKQLGLRCLVSFFQTVDPSIYSCLIGDFWVFVLVCLFFFVNFGNICILIGLFSMIFADFY